MSPLWLSYLLYPYILNHIQYSHQSITLTPCTSPEIDSLASSRMGSRHFGSRLLACCSRYAVRLATPDRGFNAQPPPPPHPPLIQFRPPASRSHTLPSFLIRQDYENPPPKNGRTMCALTKVQICRCHQAVEFRTSTSWEVNTHLQSSNFCRCLADAGSIEDQRRWHRVWAIRLNGKHFAGCPFHWFTNNKQWTAAPSQRIPIVASKPFPHVQ